MSGTRRMHFGRFEALDDAVGKLRRLCPYFAQHGGAVVKVGNLSLPNGSELPVVGLVGPLDENRQGWAIQLASAAKFKSRAASEREWRSYQIGRLDAADVDQDANVTLADGSHIFDVRLMALPRPANLTDAERLAVRTIVSCYTGDSQVNYMDLPDLSKIPLKQLNARIESYEKTDSLLPALSWEVYRSAMVKTGMRRAARRRQT